jgi:protein TonB
MSGDWEKRKFDPRSPVQRPQSPLPYFIAAAAAAILVWTAQQYWPAISRLNANLQEARGHGGIPSPQGETQPVTSDVRTVFSADDYPLSAAENGEQGTVQAKLSIDAEGRVSGCSIVRSSGHRSLDDATCSILSRRAVFPPARDSSGRAVSSTMTTPPVVWRLEG